MSNNFAQLFTKNKKIGPTTVSPIWEGSQGMNTNTKKQNPRAYFQIMENDFKIEVNHYLATTYSADSIVAFIYYHKRIKMSSVSVCYF